MTAVLRFARLAIPAPVRHDLRRWMFAWLRLRFQVHSGIEVRLERYADWTIYNEIFVNGDYDQAIALALDQAQSARLQVLDLGANAGYFTLRAFDRLLERGLGRESMAVTAIEADPQRTAEYESRVLSENGLRPHVRLITGLVGRRTGTGTLCTDDMSGAGKGQMPYLDLDPLLGSMNRIDLLKCDIEGSEQELIESYPELLARTQVAVFEFHARRCDMQRCLALLREYGFTRYATRRPDTDYSVCTLWR